MCEHEEVIDCGEYICKKCGIVLGQEYIYEELYTKNQIIENKSLDTYSNIYNILEPLNLNILCYAEEVNGLIDKYLSDF